MMMSSVGKTDIEEYGEWDIEVDGVKYAGKRSLTEAHQAGIDEAVEMMPTQKRWRKMLEGLGRGFAIYITPQEKELLLLSLREVETLKEARQKALDDTIKALTDKK